jgi:hypothetical protein
MSQHGPKHTAVLRSVVLFLVLTVLSSVTSAENFQAGSIHIRNPFSSALPPISKNGAIYLTLVNQGHHSDQLVGAATPIAERVEIHTHRMEDGMMKMRKVDEVELPPDEEVVFAPGGNHIMLIGLSQALKEGEYFPLMLHLEKTGYVEVKVIIEAAGVTSSEQSEHDHGSPAMQVHVVIEGGKVADDQSAIKMTEGDNVTLHFSSDETHILHAHGYDIEVEVGPESDAMVNFNATATGRFPVEIHGSNHHNALFYLEVYPK